MPWIRFSKEPAPPLTAVEKEALERSLDQAARGEGVPHDQVVRELGLDKLSAGPI